MLTDLRFDPFSPAAGDPLPELDLETTDGHHLTRPPLRRHRRQLPRSLDPKPNAAYLVDSDGTILFSSQWASDVEGIRGALDAVTNDRAPLRTRAPAWPDR